MENYKVFVGLVTQGGNVEWIFTGKVRVSDFTEAHKRALKMTFGAGFLKICRSNLFEHDTNIFVGKKLIKRQGVTIYTPPIKLERIISRRHKHYGTTNTTKTSI